MENLEIELVKRFTDQFLQWFVEQNFVNNFADWNYVIKLWYTTHPITSPFISGYIGK